MIVAQDHPRTSCEFSLISKKLSDLPFFYTQALLQQKLSFFTTHRFYPMQGLTDDLDIFKSEGDNTLGILSSFSKTLQSQQRQTHL